MSGETANFHARYLYRDYLQVAECDLTAVSYTHLHHHGAAGGRRALLQRAGRFRYGPPRGHLPQARLQGCLLYTSGNGQHSLQQMGAECECPAEAVLPFIRRHACVDDEKEKGDCFRYAGDVYKRQP